MISPDITISNHRLRWAVDGMRFTATPRILMTIPVRNKFYICSDVSHTHTPVSLHEGFLSLLLEVRCPSGSYGPKKEKKSGAWI